MKTRTSGATKRLPWAESIATLVATGALVGGSLLFPLTTADAAGPGRTAPGSHVLYRTVQSCVAGTDQCAALGTVDGRAAAGYSTDGGGTWHIASLNAPGGDLQEFGSVNATPWASLSCAGRRGLVDCSAIVDIIDLPSSVPYRGEMALYSHDGGRSWHRAHLPPGAGPTEPLTDAPIGMATKCYLVTSNVDCLSTTNNERDGWAYSSDGGATWNNIVYGPGPWPEPSGPSFTCVVVPGQSPWSLGKGGYAGSSTTGPGSSSLDCVSVGYLSWAFTSPNRPDTVTSAVSRDGGKSWFGKDPVVGRYGVAGDLYQVACVFVRSAFHPSPSDKPWATPGLSCSAWGVHYSSAHMPLNYVAFYSPDGGADWQPASLPPGALPGLYSPERDFSTSLPALSCQGEGASVKCTIRLTIKNSTPAKVVKRTLISVDGGQHWAFA